MKVQNGHSVKLHYKGTLKDGTEFDNSQVRGVPLEFQVGGGNMLPAFSREIVGMKKGQKKSFTLETEEAYGPRNPQATRAIPRETFGENFEFEVGGLIRGNGPTGPFLAKIEAVKEDEILLDMNHPLAGEDLTFEVELIAVDESAENTEDSENS